MQRARMMHHVNRLHETPWLTVFAYAWGSFALGALASVAFPAAGAPYVRRALMVLPLLLFVAKDLAGTPDFLRRMRRVARPGTPWADRLGALLPPELLALLKLDRAMWRAFRCWLRRERPPARPPGKVFTYTKQGAYSTVLAIVVCAVLIELPIDAAIASLFIDKPQARTVLHVMSALSAVYTLAWVATDRYLVHGAQGHVLTDTALDLSVGIRAFGTIPLAAVAGCETIDETRAKWCARRGVALRDTVVASPFDAPNLVLRLRPELPVTITHYQLEKTAPLYVFLYLDRPGELASAIKARAGGHAA